jgi:DNA polymerase alpha subunit B
MSSLELELKEAFSTKEFEEFVSDSLQSICRSSNITAEDLFLKWEEFSTTRGLQALPTSSDMERFRLHIAAKLQEKHLTKESLKVKQMPVKHMPIKQKMQPMTPMKAQKKFELMSSPPFGGSAFSPGERSAQSRAEQGKPIRTYNHHIQPLPSSMQASCSVNLVPGQQTEGYRYLYEKLTERGDLLDDRIEAFAQLVQDHKGFLI